MQHWAAMSMFYVFFNEIYVKFTFVFYVSVNTSHNLCTFRNQYTLQNKSKNNAKFDQYLSKKSQRRQKYMALVMSHFLLVSGRSLSLSIMAFLSLRCHWFIHDSPSLLFHDPWLTLATNQNTNKMHFCPMCSNLLLIEDGLSGMRFCCPTCPYTHDITKTYSSRVKLTRKEVDDVLGGADAWENVDRTETVCPACSHTTAYFMQMQIRSVSDHCSSHVVRL